MSDSDENFDLDVSGSESDGFVPTKKKATKAPAKKAAAKAAPKAAAKPKATKKTKVLADKDDNADTDDDMDEDPASVAGPSAPKETNGKKKTASEMYTKVRTARKDACMRSVIAPNSSRNSSTSSSDPTLTLEAWRQSQPPCGHGTPRISGWFTGRSSTSPVFSRLWTKFSLMLRIIR